MYTFSASAFCQVAYETFTVNDLATLEKFLTGSLEQKPADVCQAVITHFEKFTAFILGPPSSPPPAPAHFHDGPVTVFPILVMCPYRAAAPARDIDDRLFMDVVKYSAYKFGGYIKHHHAWVLEPGPIGGAKHDFAKGDRRASTRGINFSSKTPAALHAAGCGPYVEKQIHELIDWPYYYTKIAKTAWRPVQAGHLSVKGKFVQRKKQETGVTRVVYRKITNFGLYDSGCVRVGVGKRWKHEMNRKEVLNSLPALSGSRWRRKGKGRQ
ncbi:hypothetical protein F5141DRAFT_1066523 [Pisolithus sp. B1]|nr:hypothetical protein F5141DRAFT_1066523 [Pisolithus sp. B1]